MKTDSRHAAFTRIDLLALIGTLSLLALTFAGDNRSATEAAVCMNNMRQLCRAQFLYAAEHGYFPPNGSGFEQNTGSTWAPGTIGFDSDTTNENRIASSLLFNYVDRNHRVFKCISEQRTTRSMGGAPRVRTVSMNHAVGTDPLDRDGPCKRPVPGQFLNNSSANQPYRCFARPSDIVNPTPANLYIFLDEHPDSINDAMFASCGPGPAGSLRWIDIPAAYHNGAGSFGFADGHAQIHQWNRPFAAVLPFVDPIVTSANRPDLEWLASKTSALRSEQP